MPPFQYVMLLQKVKMIEHLPLEGKQFLLKLTNHLWVTGSFPDVWEMATILAFKKPGKSGKLPSDYRPIALTSCICKIYERMVNVRLQWCLEKKGCLSSFQHGFRKKQDLSLSEKLLFVYYRAKFHSPMRRSHAHKTSRRKNNLSDITKSENLIIIKVLY